MKVLFASCLLLLFTARFTCVEAQVVVWRDTTEADLGDILHLQPATHDFYFTNASIDTLRIDNVRPSCGCTSPEWAQTAIPPGGEGSIRITYDARDVGYFRKKIKVYFNQQRKAELLFISGFVE